MDLELILILSAGLEVITLICYFVLCANVASIKKGLSPYGAKRETAFALYLAMGEKEKAKAILFEMIFADEKLRMAIDTNSSNVSVEMIKYKPMLEALGLEFDAEKAFTAKRLASLNL